MKPASLLAFFDAHQFKYHQYTHDAIFTVAQGIEIQKNIPGAHSKNLFLKDRKNDYFLVSMLEHKQLDLKVFAKMMDKKDFSFAKAPALYEKLALLPGSVTPYGLIQESAKEITFILDKDFLNYELVNFHPLTNEATVGMPLQSFLHFFDLIDHPPQVIDIPVTARD